MFQNKSQKSVRHHSQSFSYNRTNRYYYGRLLDRLCSGLVAEMTEHPRIWIPIHSVSWRTHSEWISNTNLASTSSNKETMRIGTTQSQWSSARLLILVCTSSILLFGEGKKYTIMAVRVYVYVGDADTTSTSATTTTFNLGRIDGWMDSWIMHVGMHAAIAPYSTSPQRMGGTGEMHSFICHDSGMPAESIRLLSPLDTYMYSIYVTHKYYLDSCGSVLFSILHHHHHHPIMDGFIDGFIHSLMDSTEYV
jgi:hypothetical protein